MKKIEENKIQKWYDPKALKLFSDFEKKKQQQFKKDCQKGTVIKLIRNERKKSDNIIR